MRKVNSKYVLLSLFVGVVVLVSSFLFLKEDKKEVEKKTISKEETKSMLSYTLDGQKTNIKPTKESGYIANKITCENGSNLIWDNTNWEVEIIKLESNDICTVDFTTNTSTSGYRVTATTNVEGSIDSLSKATIENGKVVFYTDGLHEIGSVSGCTGIIEEDKIVVENITSNQMCNITLTDPKLYRLLSNGKKYTLGTRGTFDRPWGASSANTIATIADGYNQTGTIYKTGNDYYFAGNPSDNWVKFANKYWRIIRSNSTEGTRLLYAGDTTDSKLGCINNGSSCTTYKWYSSFDNASYVQWSYASSTIGNALTSWYSSNISSYENMVNTNATYCNDISVASTSGSNQYFGAYGRLYTNKAPSYACGTNSNSTHKSVGLMTADEVAYAGGEYGYNSPNTYYYRNSVESGCSGSSGDTCSVTGDSYWWTMSPCNLDGAASVFRVYGADYPGRLGNNYVGGWCAVRPVVTLKSSVLVSGSGTASDPFVPSL